MIPQRPEGADVVGGLYMLDIMREYQEWRFMLTQKTICLVHSAYKDEALMSTYIDNIAENENIYIMQIRNS